MKIVLSLTDIEEILKIKLKERYYQEYFDTGEVYYKLEGSLNKDEVLLKLKNITGIDFQYKEQVAFDDCYGEDVFISYFTEEIDFISWYKNNNKLKEA